MKARETFVLALVLSLALVPVLASVPVRAQGQYTERLDIYVAGSSAYWMMSLDRLNSTFPNLSTAEATAGLTSYRLVAFSTQAATSDLQVFGVDGYNVLGLPSLPSEGMFLMVNASNSASASALATFFGTRFTTSFSPVSSGAGSYVYFAPVDFAGTATPVLYRFVPTVMKGFASFLTEGTFSGLELPSISLSGVYNGSGFSHTITIGAAATGVLNSTGGISVPQMLSNSAEVLTASPSSSSSIVEIHSLDGVIQSTDKATISNDDSSLSGTYTLTPTAGAKVKVNATITDQVPTATVYREFDRGTLSTNQTLAVTIVMKNTAESGTIENFTVNDNWWISYPTIFQFVNGNYSFTIPAIAAGQNQTESYVLKVISSSGQAIMVPAATASFEYSFSKSTYKSEASLNQAVLQVNNVGPAITIISKPTVSSGVALGTPANFTLTLTNSGNSPALDLKVAGSSISSLAAGGSQTVNVPITLAGLVQTNFTKTFSLQFTNSAQQTMTISSNSVSVLMSHSVMDIPFVQISTSDILTASTISSRLLNVTYTFDNAGTANAGAIVGTEDFPPAVSCKVVIGSNGVCASGTYTMSTSALISQNTLTDTLELSFSQNNYVIPPVTITTTYEGATFHTFGGAYVIPAGIEITKSFSPGSGFPSMTTAVTLGVTNAGSAPVYNVTLSSSQDKFDTVQSGATVYKAYPTLSSQQSESFNYTVALTSSEFGNETSSAATVSLVFGGLTTGFTSSPVYVEVYKPITVTLATSPSSPEENHDFILSVTFTNTAGVAISDPTYTFTIPSGLKVLSGAQVKGSTVTVTAPSLGANSNQTVAVTLTASTGLSIETSSSHVTFQYQGTSLSGSAPKITITVSVDVTTRYTLPIIVALFVALAGLVYMRRRINLPVKA